MFLDATGILGAADAMVPVTVHDSTKPKATNPLVNKAARRFKQSPPNIKSMVSFYTIILRFQTGLLCRTQLSNDEIKGVDRMTEC